MKGLKLRLIFIFTLGLVHTSYGQFDVPDKPNIQTSVYDYIDLFSKKEKQYFEEKLVKYSDTTSTQIVIITITTTNGENINYLGAIWGEKWGIGQATEDNGILILLAQNDRRIAINTGYGVEHLLTDALSKRIIEQDIIPSFKQGNYIEGLDRGVDAIFNVLLGEYQNKKISKTAKIPLKFVFLVIIIALLIALVAFRNNGGKKNGPGSFKKLSHRDIREAIILSNSGRRSYRKSSGGFGGWNGGGSTSGGFGGGFGGGGFGGGGASGGW